MSALRNSVRLTGFLGGNPEILVYGDDKKLAKVSLATHERYRNADGEWMSETNWHNLLYWGKAAVFAANNLEKGAEISIEGRLMSRNWEDKEGQSRFTVEVVVNETLLLKPRKKMTPEPPEEEEDKNDDGKDSDS